MASAQATSSVWDRMIRASRLEAQLYEEVEADRGANLQAAAVVVGTSLAAAVGSGASYGLDGLLIIAVVALGGWALYAWITFLVGTTILRGPQTKADWGEIARTLAFANSPRALLILGVVPGLYGLVSLVVFVWVLVGTVVALRQALDFTTGRAVATAIVGWLAQAVLFVIAIGLSQA